MKKIFLLLFLAVSLGGCSVMRPPQSMVSDSIRVEIRERVERVTDTVFVEIPAEHREQTVRDTVSNLETEIARSTAAITPDGRLHHSLEQKPMVLPVETMVEVVVKDSIVYRDREVIKEITLPPPTKEGDKTLWGKILKLSAILLIFAFVYENVNHLIKKILSIS